MCMVIRRGSPVGEWLPRASSTLGCQQATIAQTTAHAFEKFSPAVDGACFIAALVMPSGRSNHALALPPPEAQLSGTEHRSAPFAHLWRLGTVSVSESAPSYTAYCED